MHSLTLPVFKLDHINCYGLTLSDFKFSYSSNLKFMLKTGVVLLVASNSLTVTKHFGSIQGDLKVATVG